MANGKAALLLFLPFPKAEVSKCGPQVSSITRELFRNVNLDPDPRPTEYGSEILMAQQSLLTRL